METGKKFEPLKSHEVLYPEVDILALEYNLSLSPSDRLRQHQASLDTVCELQLAHAKLYEQSQSASENPSSIED